MHPRLPLVVLLGALVTLPAGCGDRERSAGDSGGTLPAAGAPTATLVAEFGCTDCEGEELLAPMGIAVTRSGRVLALDQFPPFVRGFEAASGLSLAAVRQGEGPGEIQAPARIFASDDGGFLVLALAAGGLNLLRLDAEGGHRSSTELPLRVPTTTAHDPRGDALYMVSFVPLPDQDQSPRLDRIAADGTVTTLLRGDALPTLPFADGLPGETSRTVPLAARDGGFAVGDAWDYVVRLYDADGEPVGSLGRQVPRPPRSQAEVEQERARFQDWADRTGNPIPDFPGEWPHFDFHGLNADGRGRLWVRTRRGGPGTTLFDVFADGEYLGEVAVDAEMPRDYPSFDVSGGYMAGVHADDEGERIRLWRLEGG